jgi:hypothetical protein
MSNDSPKALNTPIVDGGLQRIPFFNGRVLTAEDLQTEQMASATERKRLGRALGTGVLDGLFVHKGSGDPPTTVTVESGLALAPSGHVVQLPEETDLSVVSSIEREETAGTKGKFADCARQTATVTTGSGAYLLVVRPAAKTQGRVPQTRLGGDGAAGACGAKHRVEGATLSLVRLDTDDKNLIPSPIQDKVRSLRGDIEDVLGDPSKTLAPSNVSRLRNLLAHACLRTPQALRETTDLYDTLRAQSRGSATDTNGPVDELRDRGGEKNGGLEDAVPIALLYWAQDRILFVDNWSVRRRVHRSDPQRPAPATARRRIETEAAIYQFQDHVADLVRRLGFRERAQLRANDFFRFFPPFGTIPSEQESRDGFDRHEFFNGLATRESLFVEGGTLPNLVSEATRFDSLRIDTESLIWRYHIREDVQSGEGEEPSFVVFTSTFVPHAADPQYNLARWDYANYGPGVALH